MRTELWKKIQKLAYPFFGLVYVHLMIMFLPPALKGGEAAQISVIVYSAVFISYAVLRLIRVRLDSQIHRRRDQQAV
jgi:DMSO/TMAO reductase YedYZ heme-binding membrane subunit